MPLLENLIIIVTMEASFNQRASFFLLPFLNQIATLLISYSKYIKPKGCFFDEKVFVMAGIFTGYGFSVRIRDRM